MSRWTCTVLLEVAWACCSPAYAGMATPPKPPKPPNAAADALERYEAARALDEAELGVDEAAALHRRLFDDLELQAAPPPDGYTAADWADTVANEVSLDAQAVDQVATGAPAPLRPTPGLHEVVVPSRVDKRWQLVAMYVPPSLKPGKAPLALALHGNPETESHLLGMPYLRRLADRTGTIVVAPFGRGIYDFEEPAATAAYLAGIGLPVSFYEEAQGTHFMRTLVPSLQRAWDDMHAALVRRENVPVAQAGFNLPGRVPAGVMRP